MTGGVREMHRIEVNATEVREVRGQSMNQSERGDGVER